MYRNILVPYDKSDHAKTALKTAVEMARETEGGKVTVLYVAELPDFDDPTFEAAAQMATFYAQQKDALIENTKGIVGDFKDVVYRVTSGKPHDEIVGFAKSGEFDLIVMGNRGLGALRGALGSVSYAVLRSVDIPVLIVK